MTGIVVYFVIAGVVGGCILWWAYREVSKGVKHL